MYKGGYRSGTWSSVLNAFLNWYNDYRHAHLKSKDPEGNIVHGQMPNSHQPRYGNRYYARIKALERQMVQQCDDLHVALLTFSGSSKNGAGGWRCPCDHLRDVVRVGGPIAVEASITPYVIRYAARTGNTVRSSRSTKADMDTSTWLFSSTTR